MNTFIDIVNVVAPILTGIVYGALGVAAAAVIGAFMRTNR